MADPGTQQPGGKKKTFPLWLLILVILLIGYLFYRGCTPQTPPAPEQATTSTVPEATATATAVEKKPTVQAAAPAPVNTPVPTCPPAGSPPECKNWIVLVGPDPGTVRPDIFCIGPTNTATWTSWDYKAPLKIYFPTSGFPSSVSRDTSPFLDMTRVTVAATGQDEWVFNHPSKETTRAGKPNPAFGVAGQRYCLKYDQEVNGQRADGRIIIQK